MRRVSLGFFLSLFLLAYFATPAITQQAAQQNVASQISVEEQAEIDKTLEAFYQCDLTKQTCEEKELSSEQMTEQMMQKVQKYDIKNKKFLNAQAEDYRNNQLVVEDLDKTLTEQQKQNPFKTLAQAKLSKEYYEDQYCPFFKKRFGKDCIPWEKLVKQAGGGEEVQTRAFNERNDRVELLTDTWLAPSELVMDLDNLKTDGRTTIPVWSDDYWAIKLGITSHRYAFDKDFSTWKEAIEDYSQPGRATRIGKENLEWAGLTRFLQPEAIGAFVEKMSPAEKYDLVVGDTSFSLTRSQKEAGRTYWNRSGKVEGWMGICHGWAAVSFMVPPALKTVIFKGPNGVDVKFFPHDIAALTSLAWAEGRSATNFVGGRCNAQNAQTLSNGRLSQQECFDNAPNTFLLSLGNMIGEKGLSFVFDKTFDYEVWNQPIHSYSISYFNVRKPWIKSKNFSRDKRSLLVDYQKSYKGTIKDRFSRNRGILTRGKKTFRKRYDDSMVDYVLGFTVSVVYVSEVAPSQSRKPVPPALYRVSYTGDLEIQQSGNKYLPRGGEWHNNAHPDFLWVPKRLAVASNRSFDRAFLLARGTKLTPTSGPNSTIADAARRASTASYPLCSVVSSLVNASMDKTVKHLVMPNGYICPGS